MNLYSNRSGIMDVLTTVKLCGASEDDFLYLVKLHTGSLPTGPLRFRPGWYLRDGTSSKAPILAAVGDKSRQLLLLSTFSLDSAILLPPLERDATPHAMVTEMMHATTTAAGDGDKTVAFRFSIEVGVKSLEREEFEWRKTKDEKGSGFVLLRLALPSDPARPSPGTSSAPLDSGYETVVELVFAKMTSWKHIFSLELKGTGRTGELGSRWTLMVVATALRLYWLRSYGKTNKTTVGVAEKMKGKRCGDRDCGYRMYLQSICKLAMHVRL
ncbi:hypothetical protein MFIFM68171_03063 [Madurella fahalii]|uniref:Uncharacterized protein n=1 Tax=Madurella fahalii TaxID=1157608 RepID=A0ABQ0G531_9PEZI